MESNIAVTLDQWQQIYTCLLQCGRESDPFCFAQSVLNQLEQLVPFDSASVYLLEASGKISSHLLRNVDERWNQIYLAYYINTDNQRYSLFRQNTSRHMGNQLVLHIYDWQTVASREFVPNFVRARGLCYTCGFGMHDLNRNLRTVFALDRTHPQPFTEEETTILHLLIPLLCNLHKNFYYMGGKSTAFHGSGQESPLTARESQIAELLCQSLSPSDISQTLHIAQSTTYKHIANIYRKLNVSSQRELLSKLLNPPDR